MRLTLLTARWPALSETFVRQDVANLRRLGCHLTVAALRPGAGEGELATFFVYDRGPLGLLAEALARPGLAARALAAAARLLASRDPAARWGERLKLPAQVLAAVRLATAMERDRTEHLHVHFAHATATVGLLAATALGIPFSFTGHAHDLFARPSFLPGKLRRAAFVACISAWHRQHYRRLADRPDAAYPIIRCGVDLDRFPFTEPGETRRPAAILAIGRLVPKKGFDTLIRAVADLEPGAAELTIVGEGPERPRLKALAGELGVARRVRFHGAAGHARVPQQLARADLFALPSHPVPDGDRDGIPVALIEAMAAGVPVIAGDLPAIRELVEHERTGLLADGTDPARVAGAIRRLLGDLQLRRRLARAARERVEAEFSAEVNGRRLHEAIAGARRATPPPR